RGPRRAVPPGHIGEVMSADSGGHEQVAGTAAPTVSADGSSFTGPSSLLPHQSSLGLLHYRPWRGRFHAPVRSVWPVARTALEMMFRRKLFWVFYAFGLLVFFMFFFGQYLLAWAEAQAA